MDPPILKPSLSTLFGFQPRYLAGIQNSEGREQGFQVSSSNERYSKLDSFCVLHLYDAF